MSERALRHIRLRGAREHNLAGVDVDLAHGLWHAFVGPSGSGKTSLVFDTLVREGRHRFLSSFSGRARRYFGKLGQADCDGLDGLPPTIAIGERAGSQNTRSTVGTQTGILDLLRLLFARCARDPRAPDEALTRSHFSFNHPRGACPECQGLGLADNVDPALLVNDPSKSLRAGALHPTLKNGYTVYSQVTLEVMDTICQAHGFDVHTPWADLTDEQRDVILFGTRALEVPFGKHPIESRMKWQGITARPRETGYYKGLVPVIRETLKRNRNPGVLRFVRSVPCPECSGTRLARPGREANVGTATLPELLSLPVADLGEALDGLPTSAVLDALRPELASRLLRMTRLGLDHLSLARTAASLSGGEAQRVALASQLTAGLTGMAYALDEPTLGLHPDAQDGMRAVLDELVDAGSTLLVVEHDPDMVRHADSVVHLGPGAGRDGGRILESGPPPPDSLGPLGKTPSPKANVREGRGHLVLAGATLHNLRGDDFRIRLGALNVVCGPSGAGKSSLVFGTLLPALTSSPGGPFRELSGPETGSPLALDARPIGRTSRSTPATWSGLFDRVRKRYAQTDTARESGLEARHFSFNTKGGRCEACDGLGTQRVGLHLLDDVELACATCGGTRYGPEVLSVRIDGRSIADVLQASVAEACEFFADDPSIARIARAMNELGLGYLSLGQPSSRLSRGEGQRIKLATLLAKASSEPNLLLLDEPDRGLHPGDIARLLAAIDRLIEAGHTVVAISHHRHLWSAADHRIELEEGRIRVAPRPSSEALSVQRPSRQPRECPPFIRLEGVRTHNLAGIDVSIPRGTLTAICGVSGSGKSSLAFATLAAEAWRRYAESLPFEVRRNVRRMPRPVLDRACGLGPTTSLRQREAPPGKRSTVLTQSGIGPLLRLLFARLGGGSDDGKPLSAEHFSTGSALGACEECKGLGSRLACDARRLLTDEGETIDGGAFVGTKVGAYLTRSEGRELAMLWAALESAGAGPDERTLPWKELSDEIRRAVLEGTGSVEHEVTWTFAEGKAEGKAAHTFRASWPGMLRLVEQEASQRAGRKDAAAWAEPLVERPCPVCSGSGLGPSPREVQVAGKTLPQLVSLPARELDAYLSTLVATDPTQSAAKSKVATTLVGELRARLSTLLELDLGKLPLSRPLRTLSKSEAQRARLAAVLKSDIVGTTLVLDEPTAGLGAREREQLVERLRDLANRGHTVVVVEHDPNVLRAADHLIELGPGAGAQGGKLLAAGPPSEVLSGDGPTARALARATPDGENARSTESLSVDPVCIRRLQFEGRTTRSGDPLSIPAQGMVAVTGSPGSGKTDLLFRRLAPALREPVQGEASRLRYLPRSPQDTNQEPHTLFDEVHGDPDGPRRGTVLSALGLLLPLQKLFHAESKAQGKNLTRQAFSYASPKGRCPACAGSGSERVELDFLADLDLPCPTCEGKRYRPEVLEVRWQGLDLAACLRSSVAELLTLSPPPDLNAGLQALASVGLDYLSLGRASSTLSGGELGRLSIARSSAASGARRGKPKTAPLCHLFDDPGAGLHPADVTRLIPALRELCTPGSLVVVATSQPALLAAADEIIALPDP